VNELDVRIVKLEPTHVASVHAFGEHPEELALEKLVAWAKPKGLLDHLKRHRVFGFNHPDLAPGSPNYGYEVWITVGPDVEAEGEVEVKEHPGGLYAVTTCWPGEEGKGITETWMQLANWLEDSKHKPVRKQWLEEHIWDPSEPLPPPVQKVRLDLYAPIAE
jgi:DNA gyrase inhibitor GyrI